MASTGGPREKRMRGPATYPAMAALLLLALSTAIPVRVDADPTVTPDGGGFKRATWDFATPGDYAATNVSLAAGEASLSKTSGWVNYTNDAGFLAAQQSANRVVVSNGVRLQGNTANLISDGTFDQSPGPWTYANGTTGHVLSAPDTSARAKLWHDTAKVQFDSMDACCNLPTPNWTGASAGGSSLVSQDPASMRDDLVIVAGGWSGAQRNDAGPCPGAGCWNWSAYNRLGIWINATASGLSAYLNLTDWNNVEWNTSSRALSLGWQRYIFDLTGPGDLARVNILQIRFVGPSGSFVVYVDDLVPFNYTAFDEAATVSQTFNKPTATSGNPGSVVLRFDLEATASANVLSYLQVSVAGSAEWTDLPVAPGTRSLYVDLSGNLVLRGVGTFVLEFALQLTRNGPEEASMAAWIDNVTLTATDYQSGSFTAIPIDLGSAAIWTTATLQATTNPPITDVTVETRTGNTSTPGDPTWSTWTATSGGAIASPPNRYLQWQLLLTTANGTQTPVVTRLDLAYEKFVPAGVVRTMPFFPPEPLVSWRRFFATDARPAGTAIAYDVSTNAGASWTPVVNDQDLSVLPNASILVRATLSTVNTSLTPSVAWFALRYEFIDVLYRIAVAPPDVTLTADDTVLFTATAFDQWGHVIPWFGCDWEDTDPVGNMTADGTLVATYFAGAVGTNRIYCYNSDQSIAGIAFVNVTAGALASVRVCPSPPVSCPPTVLMPVATRKAFVAEGSDADGNPTGFGGTAWSTTIGQVAAPNETAASLDAPPTPGAGRLTATVGSISGGVNVLVTPEGTPRINGTVPDVVRDEDSGAYRWVLTNFAENQPDANDTLLDLKWSLTGVDPSLYSVFGQGAFGTHILFLTPRPDAHGIDDVTLWLEDRSGARTSQGLQITVRPINDPPVWVVVPEVHVKGGQNFTLDFLPYVRDLDTPTLALALTTEDPTHIATDALNATYGYPPAFNGRTLFVRHRVSDGDAFAEAVVVVKVSSNPPPTVLRPLPDLTIPEDTLVPDVFAPDSLHDFFDEPGGEAIFLSYNYTNLIVAIRDEGVRIVVDVVGKRDFCGVDRITFRATDPGGAFAEYTVRVTVTCVNDPPVLRWTDDVHVKFNQTYRLDLEPYLRDVDNPMEELTLTTDDLEHAAVDRFTIAFLYTWYGLGGTQNQYVIPVDLTVADSASSAMQTIDVIVSDNAPPELLAPFDPVQFNEDDRAEVELTTHFGDSEGSPLAYAVTGANITATIASGRATLTSTLANWNGQEVLLIRATDPQGAFAATHVLVDVLPVNDAPVFAPIPVQTKPNGGTWVLDLRPYVNDVDNEDPELLFSVNHTRAEVVGFLLVLRYPNVAASEQIVVAASDPFGLSDTGAVSVRVDGPSIPGAILWLWSGIGGVALAAAAYVAWTRLAPRFSIEDVFLVGREGRLIMHTTRRLRADRDPDILTGMLTAIMLFVRDSFREENQDLKKFEFGDRLVAVEKSDHVYAAVICAGEVPHGMPVHMKHFLVDVEDRFSDQLARWSGDIDDLPGLKPMMEAFGRRGKWRVGDWKRLQVGPATEPATTVRPDEEPSSGDDELEP